MKILFLRLTIFWVVSSFSVVSIFAHPSGQPKQAKKKLVVIDAGHGGHDSGAVGKKHKEKDLALEMALRLGKMISTKLPDVEVEYTRTTDVFLPLYQRVGIANKKKADLFISIHCNYISNARTKGTETFVMGLHRAAENLAVAQRENEVILMENDYESNYEGYDPNSPVGYIVLSSFQDAYLEKSLDLAARIESNFANRGLSASRGVKQAGFAVLRRATMPSVLVETGFISNTDEEQWLASDEGQNKICHSITSALSSFFDKPIYREPTEEAVLASTTMEQSNKKETEIPTTAPASLPNGYTIQLAAMKSKIDPKVMSGLAHLGDIYIIEENGYYKYQLGAYKEMAEAEQTKQKVAKLGYKGAFVAVRK
ncbi:MAG: N-acetylmuramoyl-L-alanine amidase [Saprospiraceae bacterium]|nr:N-acetylmuramoyl-L-alanine amidase [Saprospiraceae bacterium]